MSLARKKEARFAFSATSDAVRIDFGARSDVGCVRESNEDSFRVVRDLNVFILCDGLGGEAHGEVASAMAADASAEMAPSFP